LRRAIGLFIHAGPVQDRLVRSPARLPLFAADRLPATVAELEAALELELDDSKAQVMMTALYAPRPDGSGNQGHPSEAVRSVSAAFDWDMYHERPCHEMADVRWRSLQDFRVEFRSDAGECEARLRERYGAPRTASQHVTDRTITYQVYGPFFVQRHAASFSLAFFAKTPDWARPPVDGEKRERFLRELAHALEHGEDPLAPPPDCGVLAPTAPTTTALHLEFAPALPAVELVRIWACSDAIGASTDVHMSTWYVKLVSRSSAEFSARLPAFGAWEISALLEGWPSGGSVEGAPVGPWGYRHLGAEDLVRHVSIRQRKNAGGSRSQAATAVAT